MMCESSDSLLFILRGLSLVYLVGVFIQGVVWIVERVNRV